jgi:RNA polymerase sigma factor (sigma-70 family)
MPKSYAPQKPLVGPPAVLPWHQITRASLCELKRMFGYVRTRHRNLAVVENKLRVVMATPGDKRHPRAIENLHASIENAKAYAEFTTRRLEEHMHYAMSCLDGTLDEIRPLSSGRKRGKTGGSGRHGKKAKEVRAFVAYALKELPTFKLVVAAAAGTWTRTVCSAAKHGACEEYKSGRTTMKKGNKVIVACKHVIADNARKPLPGHSGSEAAAAALIEHAKPVIKVMTRKSGREDEVAEQLAWIAAMEAAAQFNPAASNLARFNTYYSYKARRRTQIRTANDCPPGKIRIKGKIITRGTLNVEEGAGDSALYHPTTTNHDNTTKNAVAEALATLGEDEREIASLYLMGDIPSLRKLAEARGTSVHQVRKMVATVSEKLRGLLADFAEV